MDLESLKKQLQSKADSGPDVTKQGSTMSVLSTGSVSAHGRLPGSKGYARQSSKASVHSMPFGKGSVLAKASRHAGLSMVDEVELTRKKKDLYRRFDSYADSIEYVEDKDGYEGEDVPQLCFYVSDPMPMTAAQRAEHPMDAIMESTFSLVKSSSTLDVSKTRSKDKLDDIYSKQLQGKPLVRADSAPATPVAAMRSDSVYFARMNRDPTVYQSSTTAGSGSGGVKNTEQGQENA